MGIELTIVAPKENFLPKGFCLGFLDLTRGLVSEIAMAKKTLVIGESSLENDWDSSQIIEELYQGDGAEYRLQEKGFSLSISNDNFSKSAWLWFDEPPTSPKWRVVEKFIEHLPSILLADEMRRVDIGNTFLTQDIAIERDIPYYFLPNITLNWKTVMAPGYYEEFWDREVLLRAPAVAVRELENGWIELQTYRDLMDPLSEESLGQVRRLACYLEKYHKQAWDSILTAPELYEGGDRRPGCAGCGYE